MDVLMNAAVYAALYILLVGFLGITAEIVNGLMDADWCDNETEEGGNDI